MGILNFFKSPKPQSRTVNAFISETASKGISVEEAKALQKDFLSKIQTNLVDDQFNSASKLMLNGAYNEAIEAYLTLAEKHPEKRWLCESQIGAGYYFKKEYKKAIDYYLKARQNGAIEEMMDDNVWEACEAIYATNKDRSIIQLYLDHFPNGNYTRKAIKI